MEWKNTSELLEQITCERLFGRVYKSSFYLRKKKKTIKFTINSDNYTQNIKKKFNHTKTITAR